MVNVACCPTLDDLRKYVHEMLCRKDHLDPLLTPISHALITRREKVCGLFFQVEGPRLLRNYAVWAGEENRILFYAANGERFAETRLSEGPDPSTLDTLFHYRRAA